MHVTPQKVYGQVWIVPLFAWYTFYTARVALSRLIALRYTPFFDPSYKGDRDYRHGWLDFRACHWPADMGARTTSCTPIAHSDLNAVSRR